MTSQEILGEAIAWAVRLQSGTATEQERAECEAWRAAESSHEQAWQKVQGVEERFRSLPPTTEGVAVATLESANRRAPSNGRRKVLKLAGLGAIALAGGFTTYATVPWQQRATYVTAIGERRRVVLADGTILNLNTDSEVEVTFSLLRRLIHLKRGELFVDTGADEEFLAGRRPFWIHAAQARMEAIGTRFGVRQGNDFTRVHVTEGVVAIHALSGSSVIARAGDAIEVGGSRAAPIRISNAAFDPSAWTRGALIARSMRVSEFLEELGRYRQTPLAWEPAVADLRISGVFQLDGVDPTGRALEVLAGTLDVKMESDATSAGLIIRAPR